MHVLSAGKSMQVTVMPTSFSYQEKPISRNLLKNVIITLRKPHMLEVTRIRLIDKKYGFAVKTIITSYPWILANDNTV